ncbi:MAG TPA: UvrB/UvrC motif-containing protein [Gemmataceae bacterium]|nr:UvrB/UvrC motif-containing protein [Gemmataceae bacterium]
MTSLFPSQVFQGFGPSSLGTAAPNAWHLIQGPKRSALRSGVRQCCPKCPGVYGMIGVEGNVIYVGKAKCLRTRLLSYFRRRGRHPKAGHILARTTALAWEHAPSEFAALLRELELIRRWRPCLNVQGRPGRVLRAYVCLGRQPAPYVYLSRRPAARLLGCFGPVPTGRRAQNAVRWINDLFQLRDCPQDVPMVFADQAQLFPVIRAPGCLRYEIGTCLGPCTGAGSKSAYSAKVKIAHSFLSGQSEILLARLEQDMTAASQRQEFEQAAALRDKWETLMWLQKSLERMRLARERFSFVYSVAGSDGRNLWYLIRQGYVAGVLPAPDDAPAKRAAADLLEKEYYQRKTWTLFPGPEAIDQVLLVAAWFHRHPAERSRTVDPKRLIARCRV